MRGDRWSRFFFVARALRQLSRSPWLESPGASASAVPKPTSDNRVHKMARVIRVACPEQRDCSGDTNGERTDHEPVCSPFVCLLLSLRPLPFCKSVRSFRIAFSACMRTLGFMLSELGLDLLLLDIETSEHALLVVRQDQLLSFR